MITSTRLQIGFVCPITGRVVVALSEFAKSNFNGDTNAYFYSWANDDLGLDPWVVIDGVDVPVEGDNFDVWLGTGECRQGVPGATFVFVRPSIATALRECRV